MVQNRVGKGIGSGLTPLTLSKIRFVNLVIFLKQDGNSSPVFKKIIKIENWKREFLKNLEKWSLPKKDKPNWIDWKS